MRSRLSATGRRRRDLGDLVPERLAQARSFGCEIVDVSKDASVGHQIAEILKVPEVDCAVDCVGFETRGHGHDAKTEIPATVLNSLMEICRSAGALGIPGLYVTEDPGASDKAPRRETSASASAWDGQNPHFTTG